MADDKDIDLEECWSNFLPEREPEVDLDKATLIDPDKLYKEVVSRAGIIWSGDTPSPTVDQDVPTRSVGTGGDIYFSRFPYGETSAGLHERDSPANLQRLAEERQSTSSSVAALTTSSSVPLRENQHESSRDPSRGSMTLDVLPELNGRPWNNAAANYLVCLRPSVVLVTYGSITLDDYTWSVTVYLNRDNTIRNITQEVQVGLTGFRNGQDAHDYLHGRDENLARPQPSGHVNPRAVRRLPRSSDDR